MWTQKIQQIDQTLILLFNEEVFFWSLVHWVLGPFFYGLICSYWLSSLSAILPILLLFQFDGQWTDII